MRTMRSSGRCDVVPEPAKLLSLWNGLGLALVLLMPVGSGIAHAEAALLVEPLIAFAGEFSGLDPRQTEMTAGTTEIQVLSTEENWRLFVTVLQPLRRYSDGLDLPMQRFARLFPDLPPQILTFQPHEFRQGQAGPDWYVETQDWQGFQEALQTYIEEGDHPGRYGTTIRLELLDEAGSPLADAVELKIEFVILAGATVELLERDITVTVGFEDPNHGHGESFIIPIEILSNTSWALRLHGMQEVLDGESAQMPLSMISARTEEGLEEGWESYLPDWAPLSVHPRMIAAGTAPAPFSVSKAIVPLQLACDAPLSIPSGSYGFDFEVTVVAPCEEDRFPPEETVISERPKP